MLLTQSTKNKLYLICPTDSIETVIYESFAGEPFFYTALGAYFQLDLQSQFKLVDLVKSKKIEQIVLISSINNVFFKYVFGNKNKLDFPILKSLSQIKKKAFPGIEYPEVFASNFHLLAVKHLMHQKNRLINSSFFGRYLKNEKIIVQALVYQPNEKAFYDLKETERLGILMESIAYN